MFVQDLLPISATLEIAIVRTVPNLVILRFFEAIFRNAPGRVCLLPFTALLIFMANDDRYFPLSSAGHSVSLDYLVSDSFQRLDNFDEIGGIRHGAAPYV